MADDLKARENQGNEQEKAGDENDNEEQTSHAARALAGETSRDPQHTGQGKTRKQDDVDILRDRPREGGGVASFQQRYQVRDGEYNAGDKTHAVYLHAGRDGFPEAKGAESGVLDQLYGDRKSVV